MLNDTPLYVHSLKTAREKGEIAEWRESLKANIACKDAIDRAIRENFDGMHLNTDCVKSVIDEYGFKRTRFVLVNTMREKSDDGRFSGANRKWAKDTFVPPDREHNYLFCCDAHPAVLDGFISDFRQELRNLDLIGWDKINREAWSENLEGKVLVLKPDVLKESCWSQENQLWLATGGFGCQPDASGRAIFATCLSDGEQCRWNRQDFMGAIDEKWLPEWAQEKLAELCPEVQEQTGPVMGGLS